jgi:hypothetical protein
VYGRRIAEAPAIFRVGIRFDEFGHDRPHEQLEHRRDIVPDEHFWKRLRLDEEESVEIRGGELTVGGLVHVIRGANVHHDELGEPARMVERQAMGHAGTSIVADHGELAFLHNLNLV